MGVLKGWKKPTPNECYQPSSPLLTRSPLCGFFVLDECRFLAVSRSPASLSERQLRRKLTLKLEASAAISDPFKKLAGQSEVIPAQAGILQHATMPVTSGIGNRFPRIHGKRAFILPTLSIFILPIFTGSVEIFEEAPQSQAWLCMRGWRIVL